jgi:hypothetical protein
MVHVRRALAGILMPISIQFQLSVGRLTEQITVSAALPAAAASAPSQGSLTARSAQSLISGEFIRNYTSPVADYSQVIQMAPGTFSVSPNGVGLGDTKTFFRGFTRLLDAEFDSGRFGGDEGRSRLLVDVHQMESDGYQTFNWQRRNAFSAKYQYAASEKTAITAFASIIDLRSNTPNQKGSTRAQVDQFGDNFLLTNDPASPLYFGYNFYHIPTDFEYVGIKSELGGGWTIDDKVYTLRYYNKQNYNSVTAISATSATDKLNSYRKLGNLVPLTHISNAGIFRTGLWSEIAWTDRYQTPADPRTWVDQALPNFH